MQCLVIKWPISSRGHSRDGKTANFIDYVIAKRRLAGSIQDTGVYRSTVIDIKS